MRTSETPDPCLELGARKAPRAVYELGTASEDSNRRAVIPGWRGTFLSRSGAEGGRRPRFDSQGYDGTLKPQAGRAASAAVLLWDRCKQWVVAGPDCFVVERRNK